MPPPRKKGLANTLIKKRFYQRDPRRKFTNEEAAAHTTELDDGIDWSKMGSVTAQGDLDDFLTTAELAGTEFAAERYNARVVESKESEFDRKQADIAEKAAQHAQHAHRLTIPRRPPWTKATTAEELQQAERLSFVAWRRGLADLEEKQNVMMTPYERNIEFWRQLWRVMEKSDVLVQIVDARNPLLFLCPDIQVYLTEMDPNKRMVLMLNKSDLLTDKMRLDWGAYLESKGIEFAFFSALQENEAKDAALAAASASRVDDWSPTHSSVDADLMRRPAGPSQGAQAAEDKAEPDADAAGPAEESAAASADDAASPQDVDADATAAHAAAAAEDDAPTDAAAGDAPNAGLEDGLGALDLKPPAAPTPPLKIPMEARCRLRNAGQLVEYFKSIAASVVSKPNATAEDGSPLPPTVGMIGYPNVGKSSTINALCVEKKVVPVSATPGRTRHLQTIKLGDVTLCDCPGLVFPTFANTKAEMVCNGILPIDTQSKLEFLEPVQHVCDTVAREDLNRTYGIKIVEPSSDERDVQRCPTALEFLNAYGHARGKMGGNGEADGPLCARIILKDYVKGKLLYCSPVPDASYKFGDRPNAKPKVSASETYNENVVQVGPYHNPKYVSAVDVNFFGNNNVRALARNTKKVGGQDVLKKPESKRHNKKGKREKQRRMQNNQGERGNTQPGFVPM